METDNKLSIEVVSKSDVVQFDDMMAEVMDVLIRHNAVDPTRLIDEKGLPFNIASIKLEKAVTIEFDEVGVKGEIECSNEVYIEYDNADNICNTQTYCYDDCTERFYIKTPTKDGDFETSFEITGETFDAIGLFEETIGWKLPENMKGNYTAKLVHRNYKTYFDFFEITPEPTEPVFSEELLVKNCISLKDPEPVFSQELLPSEFPFICGMHKKPKLTIVK